MDWITLTHAEIEQDALPDACVYCGDPARGRHNETFEWHPEWAGWLLLAGFVPGLIAISLTQRKRRVSLPVCADHDPQRPAAPGRLPQILAALGSVPLCMAAVVLVWWAGGGTASLTDVLLMGAAAGGLLALLVLLAIFASTPGAARRDGPPKRPAQPLVVQEITDDGISLEGVSDGFVKALREKRQRGSTGTLPMEGEAG